MGKESEEKLAKNQRIKKPKESERERQILEIKEVGKESAK